MLDCIMTGVISACIFKKHQNWWICVAILILKMEENMQHFWHSMFYYFKEGKNTTEMKKKKKRFVQCIEKVLWLIQCVKSDLQSFLALLIFWPNNSLPWGFLMRWKVFSSTPGLSPLEANSKSSRHTQNTQISKVIHENEKCVLYFMEKTKWTFWPIQYIKE